MGVPPTAANPARRAAGDRQPAHAALPFPGPSASRSHQFLSLAYFLEFGDWLLNPMPSPDDDPDPLWARSYPSQKAYYKGRLNKPGGGRLLHFSWPEGGLT